MNEQYFNAWLHNSLSHHYNLPSMQNDFFIILIKKIKYLNDSNIITLNYIT